MFEFWSNKILSRYPILWNSKLLMVVPCMLVWLILLIVVRYFTLPTSFQTYKDDYVPIFGLTCVLFSILAVLLWFYYLNQQQTLRVFYPRSALSVYKEWLVFFLIAFSILSINLSENLGATLKWDNHYSTEQLSKDIEVIQKAELLLPSALNKYEPLFVGSHPITIQPGDTPVLMLKDRTYLTIDSLTPNIEKLVKDSLAYLEPSLIYYSSYYSSYYRAYNPLVPKVRQLLLEQNEDEIRRIMRDYLELMNRLNISHHLTEETWMNFIYHPPFYPINDSNLFNSSDYEYLSTRMSVSKNTPLSTNERYYYTPNGEINYYLSYVESYKDGNRRDMTDMTCILIYFALFVSLFIFCYRIFTTKVFLYAIIASFILLILFLVLSIYRSNIGYNYRYEFYITYLVVVLAICSYRILKSLKRQSLDFWSCVSLIVGVIAFPLLILSIVYLFDFSDDYTFASVSLLITCVWMFPISRLVWYLKSLPYK